MNVNSHNARYNILQAALYACILKHFPTEAETSPLRVEDTVLNQVLLHSELPVTNMGVNLTNIDELSSGNGCGFRLQYQLGAESDGNGYVLLHAMNFGVVQYVNYSGDPEDGLAEANHNEAEHARIGKIVDAFVDDFTTVFVEFFAGRHLTDEQKGALQKLRVADADVTEPFARLFNGNDFRLYEIEGKLYLNEHCLNEDESPIIRLRSAEDIIQAAAALKPYWRYPGRG